ncbi:MAG TPA: TetR/AcrR family transcriptional regulator [Microlunatus sp.]|nr:TetR/AcrR family transcriptional regulator [Microlunatus sp.]
MMNIVLLWRVVKGSGSYREQQAEATKDRVAAAARRLFTARGFAGTTITAISAAAGVPAQTIYSAFGTKMRILARVTEVWLRETDTRARAEEYRREPDAGRRLRLFAALNRHQLDAGADILTIYREAARTDPAMAAALDAMMSAREREIAELLTSVESELRAGLSVADALAITLALCVDAGYATLRDAGWDGTRYEEWLGDTLVGQLLRGTA